MCSCKLFEKIAEDTHVYRHVCLDKFPIVSWKPLTEKQKTFLNKCQECQNPELMYREAVRNYFTEKRLGSSYKCLQRAVKLGHLGALYVTCIILLFSGDDELIKMGVKLLGRMKKSRKLRSKVRVCREKLIKNLSDIWVKNRDLRRPICCTVQDDHKRKTSWEEEENIECEACSVDSEIKAICGYIHIY
ncbi:hypothetical protein ACJIZ3_014858 [Penstemon smallii]|uniref:At2g35280-like TPR domain-containing protein n=1 Tax=Penstemon smallii TaxID=265156 RepID=A0ABD3RKU1_9LAMI